MNDSIGVYRRECDVSDVDDDIVQEDRNKSPRGVVYFDCFSGVAGDMLLASLFDAVRTISMRTRLRGRSYVITWIRDTGSFV